MECKFGESYTFAIMMKSIDLTRMECKFFALGVDLNILAESIDLTRMECKFQPTC